MRIDWMSKIRAEQITPTRNMAVISIQSPRMHGRNLKFGWGSRLYLTFSDVITTNERDPENGMEIRLFDEVMARNVIDWLSRLPRNIDYIVVHCYAGISRSAAVAKFLCEKYDVPFPTEYTFYNHLVYENLRKVAVPLKNFGEPGKRGVV